MKSQYEKYRTMFEGFETIGISLVAEAIHRVRKERKEGNAKALHVAKMMREPVPEDWRAPIELFRALKKLHGEQLSQVTALALLELEVWRPDADRAKEWREESGLTEAELAALLGVSRDWVTRYSKGAVAGPSAVTLRKLDAYMGDSSEDE